MENIVEIPLDAPETETEAPPDPPDPPDPPEAKRGRGRPKGAPNKPKKEPREPSPEPVPLSPPKTKAPAKRKPVEQKAVKKKPVYESSESEDAPNARKTTQQIASEVLELLSSQRANQRAQRRDRYAAWFQ